MNQKQRAQLFELADLILAVGRQLHAGKAHEFAPEAWTPLESAVMRVIDKRPGLTAGEVAGATRLISSNVSRALRSLETKGLVRREGDAEDARRVRLFPTELAQQNLRLLADIWSNLLDGVVDDPAELATTTATLRRIETTLSARARTDKETS